MYAGDVGDSVEEGVVGVAVLPFSRGRVMIVADAMAEPLIEFEMLEDDRDVDRLRDGLRQAIHVLHHRALFQLLLSGASILPTRSWLIMRR
jgi:hypothetical protein